MVRMQSIPMQTKCVIHAKTEIQGRVVNNVHPNLLTITLHRFRLCNIWNLPQPGPGEVINPDLTGDTSCNLLVGGGGPPSSVEIVDIVDIVTLPDDSPNCEGC